YSLAVILYEALTGKLPFDAKNPVEFIQKHVVERPIPLDSRVPGVTFPAGLGDAIAVALSKEPGDRYPSAIEFAPALRAFSGPARTLVDGIFQLTPAPASVAHSVPRSAPRATAPGASPSYVLLATVAAVCLAAGVVLAVVMMKVLGK